jgi:hypothetical protein
MMRVSELCTVNPLVYCTSQNRKFRGVTVPSIEVEMGQVLVLVAVALMENCPIAASTTATVRA